MGDIIDFSKYKLQKEGSNLSSDLKQQKIANQILERLNYHHMNIAIPIVKIAKGYGFSVFRKDFYGDFMNVAGKLFVGASANDLYGCNRAILVNSNDSIFDQRVVVARMLGYYLMNSVEENRSFSNILDYKKIYDKYEKFILNVLAPTQMFVKQYNVALDNDLSFWWQYRYLSEFFEVPIEFVHRKVKSLNCR